MDSYDYDIIIVGSGLYGAVTAWRAREKGLRCLVLERRSDRRRQCARQDDRRH